MTNPVLKFFEKVGQTIFMVIKYPFVHSMQLEKMLADVARDTPITAKALVGTLKQFEALGPDLIAAIAADGLNLPEDLKVGADLKALFTQVKDELFPAIEAEAKDLSGDTKAPPPSDPAPPVVAVANGPGVVAPA